MDGSDCSGDSFSTVEELAADRDYANTGGSGQRIAVLTSFLLFAITSGFAWLMWAPIEEAMDVAFAPFFDSSHLSMLGSWQPIMFVILTIPSMWLIAKRGGLLVSMKIGAACEMIGVSLKLLAFFMNSNISFSSNATPHPSSNTGPEYCLYLLHLGQIFSSVSAPVAIGAPPLLSAQWFHDAQRTRATAAGVLANNLGNTIVYLVVPSIVVLTRTYLKFSVGASVILVVFTELIFATAAFAIIFFRLPSLDPDCITEGEIKYGIFFPTKQKQKDGLEHFPISTEERHVVLPHHRNSPTCPHGSTVESHFVHRSNSTTPRISPLLNPPIPRHPHQTDTHNHYASPEEMAKDFAPPVHPHHHVTGDAPVWDQTRYLFTIPASILLMVVFMWTSGAYIAWTALFDDMLLSLHTGLGNQFIGMMSFVSNMAYLIAGVISSTISDVYFPRKMKLMLIGCCVGSTVVTYFFSGTIAEVALQDTHSPQQHCGPIHYVTGRSTHMHHHAHHHQCHEDQGAPASTLRAKLLVLSFGSGFFSGAAAPLFYELLAEVSFPITSEGVSGIVLSLFENFGSLLMFQLVGGGIIPRSKVSESFGIGMIICAVLCLFIHEKYRRWEAGVAAGEVTPAASQVLLSPPLTVDVPPKYGATDNVA